MIGNDGGWTQIARDQERVLKNTTACKLAYTDYHVVAEGFGAKGYVPWFDCIVMCTNSPVILVGLGANGHVGESSLFVVKSDME